MKIFLHYEDNENVELHKSLKITLPKSWKTGPASNLLKQFIESYNVKFQDTNPLVETEMHLSQRVARDGAETATLESICSDAVVIEEMADRADIYICHGASQTKAEVLATKKEEEDARKALLQNTVSCTHFGCQKRFPKGGPYPECIYHKLPPVFHETAKYWACCPNKKAYDWDDFQKIPGCCTGTCTEVKEEGAKQFLGGTDLREQANGGENLKSIDDFNKSQSAGGSEAAPILERLQKVMLELGIEKELFDQVVEGMRKEHSTSTSNESELLDAISKDLGVHIKSMMKSIAAEQLRIK